MASRGLAAKPYLTSSQAHKLTSPVLRSGLRSLLRVAWYAIVIIFAIWLLSLGAVIAWGSRDRDALLP